MSISGSSSGDGGSNFVYTPAPSTADAGTPPGHDGDELPLVDPVVLEDLEEQLDSPDIAQNFARDYARMWDQRRRSLAAALDRQDREAALDAVISLKISSAMVGGVRLARLAEELEDIIRRGDLDGGQVLVATIADHGSATVKELQLSYILKGE